MTPIVTVPRMPVDLAPSAHRRRPRGPASRVRAYLAQTEKSRGDSGNFCPIHGTVTILGANGLPQLIKCMAKPGKLLIVRIVTLRTVTAGKVPWRAAGAEIF